jgi:archaellum component FlaG (FlaF/FlaG flagellin family)
MKKVLITLSTVLLLNVFTTSAQETTKPETINLPETSFNFGKIPQGKPVTHIFVIENTGKDSLKLNNVQASCGCTTPEWSNAPIAPGQKTQIKVGYNSAAEGPFEKSITIYYNGGEVKQITIKGHVWKTPDQSAPANEALNVFKQ